MADELDRALGLLAARAPTMPSNLPARVWERIGRVDQRRRTRLQAALLSATAFIALTSGVATAQLADHRDPGHAETVWTLDQSPSALLAIAE